MVRIKGSGFTWVLVKLAVEQVEKEDCEAEKEGYRGDRKEYNEVWIHIKGKLNIIKLYMGYYLSPLICGLQLTLLLGGIRLMRNH